MASSRLARVAESPTIRIANIANKLKHDGIDVISFSLGEPDFDTPRHISDAACKALYSGETHYSPSPGINPLREAIAKKLQTENNLNLDASNVMVTPGAKQAIFEVMMSVLDDGDEAILFDPAWVSYEPCIKFAGANPEWVPTDPENGFLPYDIGDHITDKTRLIVVNSPCNPTGGVFGKDKLKEIADLAIDHNLLVLSDEIYEKILYDEKHYSIGAIEGMQDRTITVNGFSKSYAMTGWRLGYVAANENFLHDFQKIQSHSVSSATTFAQYGAIEALEGDQQPVEDMVAEFRQRRDILVDGLNDIGIHCSRPKGAFYAFADVSEYGNGEEIAEKLLSDAHVAATPGSAFGPSGNNFVRLSYAISQERIREALERIENCLL
ncbi:pyridoxal phosphate-dependent aminotransferase [Methanohalophilus halophilus]|uniref:Aminotransferase n=1 Tax=Methanohalophilus halophilus TaxID=2177 RepID=A0A1L3Q3F7_9EURY|nr:pyridoxal phosphate-dependent aminotransferase [Methanohalophilus halophilus]APH39414.1 aspartate aminotransferase [Methanohalophilus halophilus]RNI07702.1 pyridoxal phosphate-dependent aminotransferase [Methanohalophilus halophilus]SDW96723.1 aspartate aminotransferase [Methanohalophilus halophilus]